MTAAEIISKNEEYKMLSYHNDIKIKELYVTRMRAHIEADELIRGTGFEAGRGCAVGCTLNNYQHSQYPIELGLPRWLAHLEDRMFERMNFEKSKKFPLEFLQAIPVGVDVEKIKSVFLIFVLEATLSKFDHEKYPDVKKSVDRVIELYKNNGSQEDFRSARAAAYAYAAAAGWREARAKEWDMFAGKLLELLRNCK